MSGMDLLRNTGWDRYCLDYGFSCSFLPLLLSYEKKINLSVNHQVIALLILRNPKESFIFLLNIELTFGYNILMSRGARYKYVKRHLLY